MADKEKRRSKTKERTVDGTVISHISLTHYLPVNRILKDAGVLGLSPIIITCYLWRSLSLHNKLLSTKRFFKDESSNNIHVVGNKEELRKVCNVHKNLITQAALEFD